MSDEQQAEQKKKAPLKSWALGLLLVAVIVLGAWWYFLGGGGALVQRVLPQEAALEPSERTPQLMQAEALEHRVNALETAALALDVAQKAQGARLASLDEFARKQDMQESAARLREEIRATRASFPKTLELEHSQAALALRLLELAEIEHRLFGDSPALVSLIERVEALLRNHPLVIDIRVDLARLAEDIASSDASGQLEMAEALQLMTEQAARVALRPSQFDVTQEDSVGILDRLAAGLKSLVRISRHDASGEPEALGRVQLMLALERMQVALLRRDQVAFERETRFASDWLQRHAHAEDALTQELLGGIGALEVAAPGVQREDFADLIARLGPLAE